MNSVWDRTQLRTVRTVKDPWFDTAICGIIFLNALSVGILINWTAENKTTNVPAIFRYIEIVFCAMFSLELFFRFYAWRCRFFYMKGWAWNWFDFFVVTAQLLEQVSALGVGQNLAFLRIVRIMRLVRVIRIIRVLRLIRELRTLVGSIGNSLQSLCWTALLLIL